MCDRVPSYFQKKKNSGRLWRSRRRMLGGFSSRHFLAGSAQTLAGIAFPEGPTIKQIQSRSKFSVSIDILNLARKLQSRRLDSTQEKGRGGWLARKFHSCSKFPILLEISNFFDLWATLGFVLPENRGKSFPGSVLFAGEPLQQGFRTATALWVFCY